LPGQKAALANLPEDRDRFPIALWFRDVLNVGVQRLALTGEAPRRGFGDGTPTTGVDATAGDLAAVVELKLRRAEQRVADALWDQGVEELGEVGRAIVEEQLDIDLDEGGE